MAMRPIEFRGLRTDGKGWAYGDLLHPHQGNSSTFIAYYNGHITEVNPSTVGQFTGIYDKNGVKVFEGDQIVYIGLELNRGHVIFKDGGFFIDGHFQEWVCEGYCHEMEVTGNLHEPVTVRE